MRSSSNCMLAREEAGWCCCQKKPVICKSPSRALIIKAFPPLHSQDVISQLQESNEMLLKINHSNYNKSYGDGMEFICPLVIFYRAGVN